MKFKALLLFIIFLWGSLVSYAYDLSSKDISLANKLTQKLSQVIDNKNKDPEIIISTLDWLIASWKYSQRIEWILDEIAYQLETKYFSDNQESKAKNSKEKLEKTYQVKFWELNNDNIPEKHLYIWNIFAQFYPNIHKNHIISYIVSNDSDSEEFWSVGQIEWQPKYWDLSINLPSFYKGNSLDVRESTWTLIHEWFHIVSLNDKQIAINYSQCLNYEIAEGCPKDDSYFQEFINIFWPKTKTDKIWDKNNLFEVYPKDFVTEYASTNPGEDLAESFTFFVLNDKPKANTIREQKILFFYNYPELVELRENMRIKIQTLHLSDALNVNFE